MRKGENTGHIPLYTGCCHISGSYRSGAGSYAIITILEEEGTRKGGEGPKGKEEDSDAEPTLTIRAYLPHTSETVEVSVLHTEVKFLLNASIDWLHASEVQNSTASMHFMRPYWREKVAPLAERLTLNMEPIGGLDFNTQCLLLDVDRCVYSKTDLRIEPCEDQIYMREAFPRSISAIVRVERRQGAKNLALTFTLVVPQAFGASQQDGAQPAQTIRNVLPLSVLERKAGLGQTCDGFLDAGKRDELIEKLIAKLRLTLLIPHDEKFAKAISFETLYHSTPEIQAIFPWQSTKRSLVIAIPRDESDVKFLKLYQQEAIKAAKKREVTPRVLQAQPETQPDDCVREEEQKEGEQEEGPNSPPVPVDTQADVFEREREEREAEEALAREMEEEERRKREAEAAAEAKRIAEARAEAERKKKDAEEAARKRGFVKEREMRLNGKHVLAKVTIKGLKDGEAKILLVSVIDRKTKKETKLKIDHTRYSGFLMAKSMAPASTDDEVAAEAVFSSLQLFQSRAKGITVLTVKDMPAIERETDAKGGGAPKAPSKKEPPRVDTPTVERPDFVPPLQIHIIRRRLGYTD